MYVNELISPNINGQKQYLSIRSEKEGLPLLLYLHGGPGDAALPQMLKYNQELEKVYTVVIWEQRGAGLSYYPFDKNENLTIQTFVEDAHEIIRFLLKRFHQKQVYLLAHSWGTVIGLHFIKKYPNLVHTYIGCGQVVNMEKNSLAQYNFLLEKFKKNQKLILRLKDVDLTFNSDNWLQDLMFVTKNIIKNEGSIHGKRSYFQYYLDFLFCKKYRLHNLINRIKGSDQSIIYLWKELMKTSFEDDTEFQVLTIFIEGQYDFHVSSELAKNYYERIKTNKQLYWFEKSGHFPQWEEPQRFNNLMINLLNESKQV